MQQKHARGGHQSFRYCSRTSSRNSCCSIAPLASWSYLASICSTSCFLTAKPSARRTACAWVGFLKPLNKLIVEAPVHILFPKDPVHLRSRALQVPGMALVIFRLQWDPDGALAPLTPPAGQAKAKEEKIVPSVHDNRWRLNGRCQTTRKQNGSLPPLPVLALARPE